MISSALRIKPSYMPKYMPDANCVLWFPGQDDSQSATIRDRSGAGNDGTLVGATWVRRGNGLWVVSFDGTNNEINCGTGASLNFTSGDFTLEMWIYKDVNTNYVPISNSEYRVHGYAIHVEAGNTVRFRTNTAGANIDTVSTATLVATVWQHLAVTRVGAAVKIYRNGADITATPGTHVDPVTSTDNFTIGLRPSDSYGDLAGDVALPRVHNVARSAGYLLGHYNQERHLLGV